MRRILALISIVFAAAAFVLLCLVLPCRIPIDIPIILFVIAFMLLVIVKRMKSDEATGTAAIGDNAKPDINILNGDAAKTDGEAENAEAGVEQNP